MDVARQVEEGARQEERVDDAARLGPGLFPPEPIEIREILGHAILEVPGKDAFRELEVFLFSRRLKERQDAAGATEGRVGLTLQRNEIQGSEHLDHGFDFRLEFFSPEKGIGLAHGVHHDERAADVARREPAIGHFSLDMSADATHVTTTKGVMGIGRADRGDEMIDDRTDFGEDDLVARDAVILDEAAKEPGIPGNLLLVDRGRIHQIAKIPFRVHMLREGFDDFA